MAWRLKVQDPGVCPAGSPGGSEGKFSRASGVASGGCQQPSAPACRCISLVSAFYFTRPSPCVPVCPCLATEPSFKVIVILG